MPLSDANPHRVRQSRKSLVFSTARRDGVFGHAFGFEVAGVVDGVLVVVMLVVMADELADEDAGQEGEDVRLQEGDEESPRP